MPVKTHEVSYKQRAYIHALRFNAKWTIAKIASNQGLSVGTVSNICRGPVTPKKKKGRPPTLDSPSRQLLVERATLNAVQRRKPLSQIAQECGITANDRVLRKAFRKEGYARRVARRKVFLTATHKEKRLAFALAHRHWTARDWRKVIWTDECYVFLTGGAKGKTYVTRKIGKEELFHEDCLVPKFKQLNSVMIWGAIVDGRKSELVFWDRANWGSINATTYIRYILQPSLHPFWYHNSVDLGSRLWVMEDGAPAHRARSTQLERQWYNMPSLEWPACSPDLNPIENVWGLLKGRIENKPRPTSAEGMKQMVLEEWHRITRDEILGYIDTMPDRIEEVIANNGGHTKW